MSKTLVWDELFDGPLIVCVRSPCAPAQPGELPRVGKDHSAFEAARDARLRAAEAKHAAAVAAGDFGGPGLLERAATAANQVLQSPEVQAVKEAAGAALRAPLEALPQLSMGLGVAAAGAAVVALVLVLKR